MAKHELIENSIYDDVTLTTAAQQGAGSAVSSDAKIIAAGKIAIVYAGTLESYQGIDILLGGIALLSAKRSDFILIIAGGAPVQIEHFKRMAGILKLDDNVQFLGQLQPSEARRLSASADIILSPRSSGTNTPLKTYEQLACGVPLVATAIYSHTQVLDDTLAVLVEPSHEGIAAGIERLLDSPEFGSSLVMAAQAHYARHYARPAYTRKLKRLLGHLH